MVVSMCVCPGRNPDEDISSLSPVSSVFAFCTCRHLQLQGGSSTMRCWLTTSTAAQTGMLANATGCLVLVFSALY